MIQSAFDAARAGDAPIWVGEEAGLPVAAVLVVVAVVIGRRQWRMLRAPGTPMGQPDVEAS